MSVVNVPDTDNFDLWRSKTNLIASLEGDLTTLVTVDQTSLVNAINEVSTEQRSILVLAIAMS